MSAKDDLYRQPHSQLVDFAFDDKVAQVFPDMIRRSVAGYDSVVPLTGLLAAEHLRTLPDNRHRVYDLGCSLGASTLAVLQQFPNESLSVVAVDNAQPMLDRAKAAITDPRVRFACADIREVSLDPAGVVMLNFVLQFVAPDERDPLLARIRRCLEPDGVLIIAEKLRFEDPAQDRYFDAAHLAFKRANGYSELEISQKRSALESVMRIDTESAHRARFAAAGFGEVRKWFQCLNWVSYLVYC